MIIVSAPYGVDAEYILEILKDKEKWIIEKLMVNREEKIVDLLALTEIEDNHEVMFLGEKYQVLIKEKSNGGIKLEGGKMIVNCYRKENAMDIVRKFYLDKTKIILGEAMDEMSELTGIYSNKITIKFMKTRWGSCNKVKKYINLNGELIGKRYSAIKYVALHELCHIIHGNHSKDFYDLVEKYMIDYKKEEIYLNKK